MVVPFNNSQQIHGRYQMLSPQPVYKYLENTDDNNNKFDGQEYANFMRSIATNTIKPQDKLTRPKFKKTAAVKRGQSPANTDQSQRNTMKDSSTRGTQSAPPSVYNSLQTISQIKMKNEEQHKKKMKAIEDYMFQCKQEERELKRIEGDIIKKERNIKKTMKDYENEVYGSQSKQEAQLNSATREEELIKQQYYLEDDKITKDKINRNINMIQKEKEVDSKAVNTLNGLEFRYENVAEAINLKRIEVNSLVKEFELKLKQKEEEEFRLKKEFANISMELVMEAHKHRVQATGDTVNSVRENRRDKYEKLQREDILQEKINLHKDRANYAERSKRRMSKDLNDVVGTMSMQEREDGRRLMDVKAKLHTNAHNQKEAQIKAELLEMERQGVKRDEKIMAVNARRKAIQDLITQQRKQKNDLSVDEWRQRNFNVNHEAKKQDMKDNISHFQKIVTKHEEVEHSLYQQVRQLESDRKKQEQDVQRLKQELLDTEKQNKVLLRETALRCQQHELLLQQRLQREEAQLGRALSEREERIQSLAKYRGSTKEDKHMLNEEKKVHDRLLRIEKRSNLLRQRQQYEEVY